MISRPQNSQEMCKEFQNHYVVWGEVENMNTVIFLEGEEEGREWKLHACRDKAREDHRSLGCGLGDTSPVSRRSPPPARLDQCLPQLPQRCSLMMRDLGMMALSARQTMKSRHTSSSREEA